jgi:hypothetical protein
MTYYKVLGIDPTSSKEAIRMAYFNRILTLQKVQKDPILFEQQFMQARRAFELLTDDIKRKKYDDDFARGLPGTAVEESTDTFTLLLRSYSFSWEDFSTFPQEFKTKKITAEIIMWLLLFVVGASIGFFFILGGEFDYTAPGDIVTIVILGAVFAAMKEIRSLFHKAILKIKK